MPYECKAIGSNTAKTDREFDWLICRQSQDNGSPYSALSLSPSLFMSLCVRLQCSAPEREVVMSTLTVLITSLYARNWS